ncbi:MAG: hypothetical protein RIC35_19060, partial [Marinoscillum sp.]
NSCDCLSFQYDRVSPKLWGSTTSPNHGLSYLEANIRFTLAHYGLIIWRLELQAVHTTNCPVFLTSRPPG